jgi:membrane protein YqaA with SNARE-associated domain
MLRKLYDWIVSYAAHPKAVWVLGIISFAESSVFPIPPLPLLIPMCLAKPERSWHYANVCAIASALGGIVGYAIGFMLWKSLGNWLIDIYGMHEQADHLRAQAHNYWFWVLVTKGLTPIPFKLVTIMSGFIKYNFWMFMLGSLIARFSFFYIFAIALFFYGERIRHYMDRHLAFAAAVLLFFLVGGLVLVKYMV